MSGKENSLSGEFSFVSESRRNNPEKDEIHA